MFRKICMILSFLFLLLLPVSAGNSQTYYPVSSVEWKTVNELCHWVGVAGPSSNGPVTKAQLLSALERTEKYLEEDNPILVDVKAKLESDSTIYSDDIGAVGLEFKLSPEVYAQTSKPYGDNLSDKPAWGIDSDWFLKDHKEREGVASLLLENTISDYIYSRIKLSYKQKVHDSSEYWNKNLHFSFAGARFAQNFPFDVGVSLGYKGFNLIIARGSVSLGEGYTGNTAIGDNYDYQEFMKTGFYTRNTSVFINLTYFDSSREEANPWDTSISKFTGYRNIRHAAVYELVLFDRAKFSFGSVTMLDTNTAFDFRYLNPFMILHNMYNFHESGILEANNLITVDVSWAMASKWNLYVQFSLDQIQIKGEADGYYADFGYTDPNAFGGLLNVSYTDIVRNKGILNLYAECVYNMSSMYLNTKYFDENGNVTQKKTASRHCWSQDFLVGYHREEESGSDINYSGYKYGPDCIVASLGGTYRVPSLFSISSSVLYMAHGEKGRGSNTSNYTFDGLDTVDKVTSFGLTGTVEHSLVVKAEGEIRVWKYMKVSLGVAYSQRWNYRNIENRKFSNLQGYLGFTLSTSEVDI